MVTFKSETELARVVVRYMRDHGWEVWQEVDGFYDLLGTKNGQLWGIETKLHFGTAVLAQAWRRGASLHWVSVAVPAGPKDKLQRSFLLKVARDNGIGVLRVQDPYAYGSKASVTERVPPKLKRARGADRLLARLGAIPQDYAEAGTNRGGYWTSFKGTCERVVAFVGSHPGCTVKEVVETVPTHYASKASARARLTLMCESGVVDVRAVRDGTVLRLYPAVMGIL